MPYQTPTRAGFLVHTSETDIPGSMIFIPFVFNPSSIEENDSPSYSKENVPGFADPLLQYSSGDGQEISFTLIIEQERLIELAQYVMKVSSVTRSETATQALRDLQRQLTRTLFSSSPNLSEVNINNPDSVRTLFPINADAYIELIRSLIFPRAKPGYNLISASPPPVTLVHGPTVIKGRVTKFSLTRIEFISDDSLDNSIKRREGAGTVLEVLGTDYAEIQVTFSRYDPTNPRIFSQERAMNLQSTFRVSSRFDGVSINSGARERQTGRGYANV